MTAHNFEKLDLPEAYNTINKSDVIYLSESYLDSSIVSDNDDLNIKGYNLYRAGHPNNVKRGGDVRVLGNRYLLDVLVTHIYKNLLCWKFLLITKMAIVIHCIDP